MSEIVKLGELVTGPAERDAVHIAVMPVFSSDEELLPGTPIGFVSGSAHVTANPVAPYKHIGIADPFLKEPVPKHKMFYMCLFPNTITSLRHNWSHPEISSDGCGIGSESEKWLRDFADQVDADYDEMMYVAGTHCQDENGRTRWGSYLCQGGKWEGQSTPDEFWKHYEVVTGKKPARPDYIKDTEYYSPGIFTCSC